MTASVVVLSHKPGDWLRACLESALPQADEVILVDNGSDGATATATGESCGARVVRSERNLGYAAGVNLGVHRARGDVIALLNDDAVAQPGWLDSAAAVLDSPGVAAVVPKVRRSGWYREVLLDDEPVDAPGDHRALGRMMRSVTCDGEEVLGLLLGAGVHELESSADGAQRWRWTRPGSPFYVPLVRGGTKDPGVPEVLIDGEAAPAGPVCRLLNKAGGYLRRDGVLGDIGDESPDDGRWDRPAEPFFGSGTALVTRRDTFLDIGGLAERFFAYYEDADWCWRARLAGMTVSYDPSATVEHRHSATMGASSPLAARLANRNRLLTMARNAPLAELPPALRRARAAVQSRRELAEIAAGLPWALRSRVAGSRQWSLTPEEVWSRWVDEGTVWDRSPCRA